MIVSNKAKMENASAILVALFALAGCGHNKAAREWKASDHQSAEEASASNDGERTQAAPQTENAAGKALWLSQCATCHGEQGQGDGPGKPPMAQMPNLTDPSWHSVRSDEMIASTIANGRGMMPPFKKSLKPEAIAALVAHIRSLAH